MTDESDKKLISASDSKIAVTDSGSSSIIDVSVSDSLRRVEIKEGDQNLVYPELEQQKSNLMTLLESLGGHPWTDTIQESWESMIGERLGDIVGFLEDMGVCWFPVVHSHEISWNSLEELDLSGQGLEEIDLTDYPYLKRLNCSNNNLRYLDLSQNSQLIELNCSNNQLINLDLWFSPDLTQLDCSKNNLVYLDVTNSPKLVDLDCKENALAGLNVSKVRQDGWFVDADVFVFFSNYLGKNPSLWNLPKYKEGLDNVFRVLNETSEYVWWGEVASEARKTYEPVHFWKQSVCIPLKEVLVDENGSPISRNILDSGHDLHSLRRLKFRFNPKFRDFY